MPVLILGLLAFTVLWPLWFTVDGALMASDELTAALGPALAATVETTSAIESAAAPFGFRTRNIHADHFAFELRIVQRVDSLLAFRVVGHFDKAESA